MKLCNMIIAKYKVYIALLIGTLFFAMFHFASADIRINEIAWMGTANSANDEWIELYNTGSDPVDLSGWSLVADDDSPTIALSGTISGSGYFLMERTDDSSAPTASADHIYTGALGNDGENLSLRDGDGAMIDTVNHSGGWLAGDNETKYTMQYDGSSWVTAIPTPRAANNSGSSGGGENQEEEEENSSGSGGSNDNESESSNSVYDEEKDQVDHYTLNLQIDPVVVAGVPAEFTVGVYKNGKRRISGIHSWNFGDGTFMRDQERYRRKDMEFTHTYEHPGTYVAIFEYRTSVLKDDPDISHRVTITVTDHNVVIADVTPNHSIVLENTTDQEVDVGLWRLMTNGEVYEIPEQTIILPNNTLTLSQERVAVPVTHDTVLQLPSGDFVATGGTLSQSVLAPIQSSSTSASLYDNNKQSGDEVASLEGDVTHSAAATVVFSDTGDTDGRSNSQKSNTSGWYWVLGIVVIAAILLIAAVILFIQAPSRKDGVNVDDITIIEDD